MLQISLHRDCFNVKPNSQEAGLISRQISYDGAELTARRFVNELAKGRTWSANFEPGKRNADGWLSQQLFAADIDEGTASIKQVELICERECLEPLIIHESFSSTAKQLKLRVIFATEEPVTDKTLALQIQMKLAELFGGDPAVCDIARLYYGTNKPVAYFDKDADFRLEELAPLPEVKAKADAGYEIDYNATNEANREQQKKLLKKLAKTNKGRFQLIVIVYGELKASVQNVAEGSGYQSVWKAACRLGQFKEMYGAYITLSITDWVNSCDAYYGWQHRDELEQIIATGIKWGRKHPYD